MKKQLSFVVAASGFIGVAGWAAKLQAGGKGSGTSVLHFFAGKSMQYEGTNTSAVGFAAVKQTKQGSVNNQTVDIKVANLATNATYDLFSTLDDDTNLTQVAKFETDARGRASLPYQLLVNRKGQGHAKSKMALPAELNPITNIRELAVGNTSTQLLVVTTQIVLRADLTLPDKLQYLIKRELTNDGIDLDAQASLRIKATEHFLQFRLRCELLDPGTSYFFVINGEVVSTNVTDVNGDLNIECLPAGPLGILDVHQVAVWNSASNNVLSTTLP